MLSKKWRWHNYWHVVVRAVPHGTPGSTRPLNTNRQVTSCYSTVSQRTHRSRPPFRVKYSAIQSVRTTVCKSRPSTTLQCRLALRFLCFIHLLHLFKYYPSSFHPVSGDLEHCGNAVVLIHVSEAVTKVGHCARLRLFSAYKLIYLLTD